MAATRRPPAGVRYRRALRALREANMPIRAGAAVIVVVLLADIVSAGAISGGGSTANTSSASGAAPLGTLGSPLGGTLGSTLPGASGTTTTGASGKHGGPGTTAGGATTTSSSSTSSTSSTTSGSLTASDRGVTPTSIKVVFPWPNLGPVGLATGIDVSSEDPVMSINTYVNDINAHGGINGRKIVPEIVGYNPLDDAAMRADCLEWTQDQQVFAVVDSDAWHDDNQLCVTQEGHTPLISGWAAVPQYSQSGAPNLWWTGPDSAAVLENLVSWAVGAGYLTAKTKFGILTADRTEDTIALNQYMLPTLARYGLKPADVEVLHYDSSDGADSAAQAPLFVARLKASGVNTLIPMVPFLNWTTFLSVQDVQKWYPTELLSDYESELEGGLGLADEGFAALQNQEGVTSFVLGEHDDTRGYDAQGQSCYQVWMKANPGVTPPPTHWLESTGTAMTYCQNIRLFAQAARAAGTDLTRAGFDAAMAKITDFQGTVIPSLSYSSTNFAGPHEFRVVRIHENPDGACPKLYDGKAQGSCWLVLSGWREMATTGVGQDSGP